MRGITAIAIALAATACACAGRVGGPRPGALTPIATCPAEVAGPGAAARPPDGPGERVDATADGLAAFDGEPIAAIEITGVDGALAEVVRGELHETLFAPLAPDRLAADLRRVEALGAFARVELRVRPDVAGAAIELHVTPRPRLAAVELRGDGPAWARAHLAALAGALDEPVRTERLRRRMVAELVNDGYRDAAIDVARAGAGLCVAIRAGRRFTIDHVALTGDRAVPDALIERTIARQLGRINARGGAYRPDLLPDALDEVARLYADRGYVDARIDGAARYDDARGAVTLTLAVTAGRRYAIGAIALRGDVADLALYRRLLGLTSGQEFARRRVVLALSAVETAARRRGAEVETTTHLDADHGVVDLELRFTKRSTR